MTDDLSLIITPASGGLPRAFKGWTSIRVTRGIERCPSDFQVTATEINPGNPALIEIDPGDSCQVLLGSDLVLTGYVDRVLRSMDPQSHTVTILGRSKCEDIVDCSAEFQTFQFTSTTAVQLAQKLCDPFGIKVAVEGDIGSQPVPEFNVSLTETPYEIIEEVCRYSALLCFDGRDGNLILARAGAGAMTTGFVEGANVQSAQTLLGEDQRYSDVRTIQVSNQFLFTEPSQNAGEILLDKNTLAKAEDPGVKRFRPLLVVGEQNDLNHTVAKQRAQWEVNRRWGRSQQVRITCDSWRDGAGTLWQLNALARVDLPSLKISNKVWLIGMVSFVRDESGTRAEVTLMPKEAFDVKPIVLPYDAALAEAVNYSASQKPASGQITTTTLPPQGGAAK